MSLALLYDVRHDHGIWLFDCGEGSQIQLMKSPLKPGKINKIFITHLHGDHLFGLPGLLCTISQNNQREDPVEIYGPVGLRSYVCTSLALSRSEICFDFIIHEMETLPMQTPTNAEEWPMEISPVIPFHPCEKPGRKISPDENDIWHLCSNSKLAVRAVWVKHRIPSFTFVIQEREKPGKLDSEKLKALGVSPGPVYSRLKAGETVYLDTGQTISPQEVIGAAVPGRMVVISGDSCDSTQLTKIAKEATVLVHETTLENSLREQCVEKGHSTPEMTAKLAKDLNVKMLIITHFSARYKPLSAQIKEGDKSVRILLEETLEVLPKEKVTLAEDLLVYPIPR